MPKTTAKRKATGDVARAIADARLSGVLIALSHIYGADEEALAEEIIRAVGERELLKVAIAEEDYCLPQVRRTIRFLRARGARNDERSS